MPRRTRGSQTKHDREVGSTARRLAKRGYEVRADLPGWRRPDTIGGYRPDVVAVKGTRKRIVEVETPDSLESPRSRGQRSAFRRAASRSSATTFTRKVTR